MSPRQGWRERRAADSADTKDRAYKSLVMIGDGATDLEARQPGGADLYICYGGVQLRESVAAKADWLSPSFAMLSVKSSSSTITRPRHTKTDLGHFKHVELKLDSEEPKPNISYMLNEMMPYVRRRGQHNEPELNHHKYKESELDHHDRKEPKLGHHEHKEPEFDKHEYKEPELAHHECEEPKFDYHKHQEPKLGHHEYKEPELGHHEDKEPKLDCHNHKEPELGCYEHKETKLDHHVHNEPKLDRHRHEELE
nr:phosphoserine phosphatase, chloroplastic-like isoform X5 [Ipomoea batatas]